MRRSASEIINELEGRIARLERQASSNKISNRDLKTRAEHILKIFNNGEYNRSVYLLKKVLKDLRGGLGNSTQIQATQDVLTILEGNAKKLQENWNLERSNRLMVNDWSDAIIFTSRQHP